MYFYYIKGKHKSVFISTCFVVSLGQSQTWFKRVTQLQQIFSYAYTSEWLLS